MPKKYPIKTKLRAEEPYRELIAINLRFLPEYVAWSNRPSLRDSQNESPPAWWADGHAVVVVSRLDFLSAPAFFTGERA